MPRSVPASRRRAVLVLAIATAVASTTPIFAGQQTGVPRDFYGLYYAEWKQPVDQAALVISSDGKPIPQKANDPDAPTLPGFYVDDVRYPLTSSETTSQTFHFQTASVNRHQYSFQGRFGRDNVEGINDVPYLQGVLTEMKDGRVIGRRKMHFGHAVIL